MYLLHVFSNMHGLLEMPRGRVLGRPAVEPTRALRPVRKPGVHSRAVAQQ